MTTLLRRWHRRHPLLHEFLQFFVVLYGMWVAVALAILVYAVAVTRELQLRLPVPYCLGIALVLSWVSGYTFSRWMRS